MNQKLITFVVNYTTRPLAILFCFICLSACSTYLSLEDGVYFFETNPKYGYLILGNFGELSDFKKGYYLLPMKLNSKHEKHLQELISDKKYKSLGHDLITCNVSGCFAKVKERRITSIVYSTCNHSQLEVIGKDDSERDGFMLSEAGQKKIDTLREQIIASNMDIERINFPPKGK